MNYLVIDATGTVVNVCIIDDVDSYTPPAGHSLEPATGSVWIGWRKIDGAWQEPAGEEQ